MLNRISMKYLFTILCFIGLQSSAFSQFGVSARFLNNSNSQWDSIYQIANGEDASLFSSGIEIGVNYWFRLKNQRIEFLPEITYGKSSSEGLDNLSNNISLERTTLAFNTNIQIYPLDFEGDCDCPTFSKDGDLISKGFYWLINPSIVRHTLSSTVAPTSSIVVEDQSVTSFRVGLGAGLDIGVADFLTVSPFAQYSLNFGNDWPQLTQALALTETAANTSTNINQLHIGMRLIFRPDYKSF